jgi:integrase
LALFILIRTYTGRRKEAILSLRWPKVDLARRKIDFRREGVAETKKKPGQCAIPSRLLPHLRRARKLEFDIVTLSVGEASPLRGSRLHSTMRLTVSIAKTFRFTP